MLRKAQEISLNLRRTSHIHETIKEAEIFESQHADEIKNGQLTAEENLGLGLAYLEAGKNHKDNHFFADALKVSIDPNLRAECFYGLGAIARSQNNTEESLKQFKLALFECKKIDTSKNDERVEFVRLKSNILRNRGLLFLKIKDLDNAAKDFKKSIETANEFPEQFKGFLPAVTAYYALVLCKQETKEGNYDLGFAQFAKADQLYLQFPREVLKESMDYGSFQVHMARIYQQLKWLETALAYINIGYKIRYDNLIKEQQENGAIGDYYITSRMGDVEQLRNEILLELEKKQENIYSSSTLAGMGRALSNSTFFPYVDKREDKQDLLDEEEADVKLLPNPFK